MKNGFAIPTLCIVLCAALYAQQASSQAGSAFDPSAFFDGNTGLPGGIEEQISIVQVPTIPQPGQGVSVQISSYSSDLNKARITWTLDGRVLSSQTGATSLQFTAPQSGETSRLVITITKEGGGTITKTIVINPAEVDLIYEADTYTHPFYKGKRLYTSESNVDFIAIPNFVRNGRKIPSSELVYTWKINGNVRQDVSGYGRSVFSTKGSLIERPMTVSVDVSAVNSTLKATQSISLQSTTPEIVLYENNPLLGVVYEKAVSGTFNLERPQVDFEGIPYFFSGSGRDDTALNYKWYINGVEVLSKSPNENYVLLQNDKNLEGSAVVSVSLSHASNILQNAKSSLGLEFKKSDNKSNEEFNF